MNISEHEYLLPIIIGNGKEAVSAARRINKKTGARVHLFASKFPFLQRAFYTCHTVEPMMDEFLLESLTSYLASVEEYFCPVIIICDDRAQRFAEKHSAIVESICLVTRYNDFFTEST